MVYLYLTSKIRQVLEYSSEDHDFSFMQLRDHQDNEIGVEELVDRYYKDSDRYFQFNGNNNNKNNDNGSNIGSHTRPALPLLILSPALPPTLLLSPLVSDIQLGQSIYIIMQQKKIVAPTNIPKAAKSIMNYNHITKVL
jgi:hypothetical protein